MASDPAISIGNYKGVMLCNRPFVGAVSQSKKGGAPAKQAFVCGKVDNKLGVTIPISKGKSQKSTSALERKQHFNGIGSG